MTTLRSIAVASCLLVIAACAASASTAAKDVSITSCTASPTGGHPTAAGGIANHSSQASAYVIQVKFTDATGNRVGDGVAAVAKVAAGGTANWHASGTVDANGPLTCKLASVARTASP